MKNLVVLIALVIFSLLTSCKHEPSIPPVNIISLVDFSPSRDTSVVYWYKDAIAHSLLGKMNKKDRVIVLPVDFNSQTSSQEIFSTDFSRNDYTNEFAGMQKDELEQQNHLDSVHAAVARFKARYDDARLDRPRLIYGTDLFGALSQARKYIVPGYRNIVVIWSDMLQYTDKKKWNFEDYLNTPADVEHYLSIADTVDLDNLDIIVVTGAQNEMRPEKFKIVKTFWEKYFAKCHGRLLDYSSGAVSKLENELKQ